MTATATKPAPTATTTATESKEIKTARAAVAREQNNVLRKVAALAEAHTALEVARTNLAKMTSGIGRDGEGEQRPAN